MDCTPREFTLEYAEEVAILRAMEFSEGKKTLAAQLLGITIKTLDVKLRRINGTQEKLPTGDTRFG